MLTAAAAGVHVHQSELLENNSVVIQGSAGVLVVDAGIEGATMACLANDVQELGQAVVAGFSTHPDWDHVLWHPDLGDMPRYGTAACAAFMSDLLSQADWRAGIYAGLPPEIADEIPLELFGLVTALPGGARQIPWDGPVVRVIEHPAHAQGHAALLIKEQRVLIAGDMLSDVLVPMPDLGAADPIGDYLAGLQALEDVAADVDVVIPGHGSVGDADELRVRLDQDRTYLNALQDGRAVDDPRIGSSAKPGWEWVSDLYEGQAQRVADLTSGRSNMRAHQAKCPSEPSGEK